MLSPDEIPALRSFRIARASAAQCAASAGVPPDRWNRTDQVLLPPRYGIVYRILIEGRVLGAGGIAATVAPVSDADQAATLRLRACPLLGSHVDKTSDYDHPFGGCGSCGVLRGSA